MAKNFRKILTMIALSLFFSTAITPARPQNSCCIGASKGQVAGVIAGLVGAGAAIGVGVYFLARHDRTLTGCATTGSNGLVLRNEADQQSFDLAGVVDDIKPGQRVRVSGKKKKPGASGNRTFLVEKLSKRFGPCQALPATP